MRNLMIILAVVFVSGCCAMKHQCKVGCTKPCCAVHHKADSAKEVVETKEVPEVNAAQEVKEVNVVK